MPTITITDARAESLRKANAVTQQRGAVLNALRTGERSAQSILRDLPTCLRSMFVFDFLDYVPWFGPGRVKSLNAHAIRRGANLAVPLGDLTPRNREWLAHTIAVGVRPAAIMITSRPQG